MRQFNAGIIGLGNRGTEWVKMLTGDFGFVNIAGLCDVYPDRVERAESILEKTGRPCPALKTGDFRELIASSEIDTVLVFSSWSNHFEAAVCAMEAGKPVAVEVGGAYSVDECFELVRTHERTGTPYMLLENCCFGEYELMVLNMVRGGLLGDVVHCSGGYLHDLRSEVGRGNERRHYRFGEYLRRNCENYPTHELGPISKILKINEGNRFVSLVSVSSRSSGLEQYIRQNADLKDKYSDVIFAQGDVVNTLITCADGTTVALTLDTTTPRYYSRGLLVKGTGGMYEEATRSVFLDCPEHRRAEWDWSGNFNNRDMYKAEWAHPIWRRYREDGVRTHGHGGMDFLVMDSFFVALELGLRMPVDVYDAAVLMAVTPLSAQSISGGNVPVQFPDFTSGRWKEKRNEPDWKYSR